MRQTRRQPACWPGRFSVEEKAKTSGPARALANNANARNGEGRFHRVPLSPLGPVAVKTHRLKEKRLPWSASCKRKILLNMSIHERGKTGRNRRRRHDFVLFGQHQPDIDKQTPAGTPCKRSRSKQTENERNMCSSLTSIAPSARQPWSQRCFTPRSARPRQSPARRLNKPIAIAVMTIAIMTSSTRHAAGLAKTG